VNNVLYSVYSGGTSWLADKYIINDPWCMTYKCVLYLEVKSYSVKTIYIFIGILLMLVIC